MNVLRTKDMLSSKIDNNK